MATVHESVRVNVPLAQAYNQWTQFEEFPRFMSGIESVRQVDEALVHFTTGIAGVRREFDARITTQVPDERIAWESVDAPRSKGEVTFRASSATETEITVDLDWQPETPAERLGAGTRLDDRLVKRDLQKFKEFIEHRETETGGWRGSITEGHVD
ncbi:SRPBCC family protein [Arthrobacter cupressi]|uniref:Polyketide cyclase / dehydrase and lipid transport n=1 Tax=Arthrobacter cupressi TaxID=1045773 RepID=A0A1G8TJ46_9MICC|nr:SRPBCC family protein [Arthrobacter cupressi]NYD79741.1 putative membrane protein [Arthrobacter cupressi]SDJ40915.1 Polyketide cyclase / dehydrase and lipid transport [Arthrobacter cupressi]